MVQMRKAEAQRDEVMTYGQNPTRAQNDAFPTLFQLASGLRLLQKYGESYETLCLKKKKMGTDIYMQMM